MDEELVILVQSYPALYDMSHKDYDNHLVKENMWKEIATSLNKSAEECKSKWALLRSYFVKARNRRKTTSGQAAKKVKKWRLEDQMEFLTPFLQDRQTQSNVMEADPDEPLEVDTENVNLINESSSNSSTPLISPASASSSRPRYARQQSKSSQPEQGLEQTLRSFITSRTSSETSSEKKALMVFFDDIAESMLKFSERERAEIKRDIFRIVNDKEIDKLIQAESSVHANNPTVLQPITNANRNQTRDITAINSGTQPIPIYPNNYMPIPISTPVYDQNYYNQQRRNEQPDYNIQQQQAFSQKE